MSRTVTFIDTSVLVEVLRVPGKSQQPAEVTAELRARTGAGESMILPTATIIETGNHIAKVGDGTARRTVAERFAKVLEATIAGDVPWALNGARWDEGLLAAICRGTRGCPPLPDMATQGHRGGRRLDPRRGGGLRGAGGPRRRAVWTLEHALSAYA